MSTYQKLKNITLFRMTWKITRPLIKVLYRLYLKFITSYKQKKAIKSIRKAKKNNQPLKVAFIMVDTPYWKNESLFKAMMEDERFLPTFWILDYPYASSEEIRTEMKAKCITYAQKNNFPYFVDLSLPELRKAFRPHYLFVVFPYDDHIPFKTYELKYELPCYIPYCYINVNNPRPYNGKKIRYFHRFYLESDYIQREARKHMKNGAVNTKVTGLPMSEWLISKQGKGNRTDNRKHIIWAPHWTIDCDLKGLFTTANFLRIADDMLTLTKKYKDEIFFIFKPHPLLKRQLYSNVQWGKERTNIYYRAWSEGTNTSLEEGNYANVFARSDAMIHDSGSFILEYLLMDKPCMYVQLPGGQPRLNQSTQQALECYQKGSTTEDIEHFIQDVLEGNDPLSKTRHKFIHSYLLPNNQSPVQNIIEDLLNP